MKLKILILFLVIFCFATDEVLAKNFLDGINFTKKNTKVEQEAQDTNPLALHDDAVAFYNTNDIENALEVLNKIPDEQKIDVDYLMLANIMQDKDQDDKAAEYLNKAIQLNPKFYKAYYNLGNIYLADNQVNIAINYYKKSIKYNKDFAYAYYNIGVCYAQKKEYKKAISYFNRAILRKNDVADFYYNLAFAYKQINKTKNAQKALNVYNTLINR